MASPGTEHEDESASSATDASSRDHGDGAKPPEPQPEAKTDSRVASPPVEAAAVEPPPVESPPAAEAPPARAAPEPPTVAETAPAPVATEPVLTEATQVGPSMAPTGALPAPPLPVLVSSSPSIDVSTRSSRLAAQFGARPNGAWLAVGGAAAILTFVFGVFTGRGLRTEPERRATAATPPPKAAPASPAPSSAVGASPGASAEVPIARPPRIPATATKPASAAFNAQAAKLAIDRIVPRLKACKQAGEPPGSATVTVTFASSGRVSSAQVTNTRYAGTRTGNCIAQRLREARIPEFTGAPVTVKRSVAVR